MKPLPPLDTRDRTQPGNPVLFRFLGLCPALAVTNTLYNAAGMALGTASILLGSALLVSWLSPRIPDEVRTPCYILLIAGLVSLLDLLLRAYFPFLSRNLGPFVPLIVVNCLILAQAEGFARRNPPLQSLQNAWREAVGFGSALLAVAFCRELFGTGALSVGSPALWPEPRPVQIGSLPILSLYQGQIQTPLHRNLGGAGLRLLTGPAGALLVIGYLSALASRRHPKGTGAR